MTHNKKAKNLTLYRRWAVILTLFLCFCEAVYFEAERDQVNIPFSISSNDETGGKFWIFIPGTYHFRVKFYTYHEEEYKRLEEKLGNFACFNSNKQEPCGKFSPYRIRWEILKDSETYATGVGTERTRNGTVGGEAGLRTISLGEMKLGVGKYDFRIVKELPLANLEGIESRLVLFGGTGGGKSFPSWLVVFVLPFWWLGRLFLWYVVIFLWAISVYLYVKVIILKSQAKY